MLIAAAVPIFVAALALASFLNGFWMVSFSFSFTAWQSFDIKCHYFILSLSPRCSAYKVTSLRPNRYLDFGTTLSISL